jgi:hypothetical protein
MEIKEGNYTIKALPTGNKSWRETDDIEITFLLDTE